MNQNFNAQELFKYLKKGELSRCGLTESEVKQQIRAQETAILEDRFEFEIKSNSKFYFVEDISQKLLLRKLNDNIRRIYKDEQSNRKVIIHQVKTLLNEDAPFWIMKTDIKSFYESINQERVFKKLKNDAILSYYSLILIEKIFDHPEIKGSGLPRGLNISSTLSEMYMRKFDESMQRHKDVYYYTRFVDDVIVFLNNKTTAKNLFSSLGDKFKNLQLDLEVNLDKTEVRDGLNFSLVVKGYNRESKCEIEYLGYKFFRKNKLLQVSIADKKIKTIKTRIVKSYLDYLTNKDFSLLQKRLAFLTGNYGISKSNDGSVLKAGIYFNYAHINNLNVLKELNTFNRKILFSRNRNLGCRLNNALTARQRNVLKRYCFIAGFKNKTYMSFNYVEMGAIIKCWKYGSDKNK